MTPLELLRAALAELGRVPCRFAVAGGLAASLYRAKPRLTDDIDIAFAAADNIALSRELAVSVVAALGYRPALGWVYSARLDDPVAIVIGQPAGGAPHGTIDLLLPVFPWLVTAVERAQHNLVDYGFAAVPTITPEDLVVSKVFALAVEPNRFQDLDDVQSVFQRGDTLDLAYILSELERLNVSLPPQLEAHAPKVLRAPPTHTR